jgi:DNA-binding IscR family transcriptional regulator
VVDTDVVDVVEVVDVEIEVVEVVVDTHCQQSPPETDIHCKLGQLDGQVTEGLFAKHESTVE